MIKHIKIVVFVISLLIVYFIYSLFLNQNSKIIYIPLGDSIAEGMTPYNVIDYGYTDYVADYLKHNNKLSFYTKAYAKSGYTIENVTHDINDNKTIEIDGKKYYLKEMLRESDLVTLTIGANDFIKGVRINNISAKISNITSVKKELDNIANDFRQLVILIKKYAKNQIIVTGYFNPLPSNRTYKEEIDEIVKYYNSLIEDICDELDVDYVNIFDVLEDNPDSFSNPLDVHPNKKGYELISKEIVKIIE